MLLREKRNLFSLFYIAAMFTICAVSSFCQAQEHKFAQGELRIEGEHIAKLVLVDRKGHKETIDLPSETIQLRVGEYRLQQVTLDELNITSLLMEFTSYDWIIVSEDKPAVLKAGAPLSQMVEVTRRGSVLVLDYKLRGIGGEIYTNSGRRIRPVFAVYKDNKKIASDKFEYG